MDSPLTKFSCDEVPARNKNDKNYLHKSQKSKERQMIHAVCSRKPVNENVKIHSTSSVNVKKECAVNKTKRETTNKQDQSKEGKKN